MGRVSADALKKTPLYDAHLVAGGKMVDFGGWCLPVQYGGILEEHHAVRNAAGLFDISHMGEVFVSGPGARAWLNGLLTNNVERLSPGECQYTFLLNENGGVLDDLIVYQLEEERYLLVVNASRVGEDVAWLRVHLQPGVTVEDQSNAFAGLAVQGPHARAILERFLEEQILPLHNEIQLVEIPNMTLYLARTGYTGEDGFELFCDARHAGELWRQILALGAKPCGLGARDTLRLEMGYPLNGSDLSPERTPLEAGLSFFVDLEKPEFIGRARLLKQRKSGIRHRLMAFKMQSKAPPPRAHYPVFKNGRAIAETTSGTLSPSLGIGIGMAYIPVEFAQPGETIEIEIRDRRFPATIEKKPLYKKTL